MNDEAKHIELELADAIMERAYPLIVGRKQFFLYPVTLGKMYLLQRLIDDLGIDYKNLRIDTNLEMLRLAKEKREKVCTILAYHTCETKEQLQSVKTVKERVNLFMKEATDEDLASILIILLSRDKTETFMKHTGIDKENERLKKVIEYKDKKSKNTLSFGGKSLYGTFIAPLLDMGLSWNEIVWERSYTNLRMLLADKMNSIYLTDEELNGLPANLLDSKTDLDANNPAVAEKISKIFASKGIKTEQNKP